MYLTLSQLTILVLILPLIGGLLVYIRLKVKMKYMKEEALAMRRSLQSLWDNQNNWNKKQEIIKEKYEKLLKEQTNKTTNTEENFIKK